MDQWLELTKQLVRISGFVFLFHFFCLLISLGFSIGAYAGLYLAVNLPSAHCDAEYLKRYPTVISTIMVTKHVQTSLYFKETNRSCQSKSYDTFSLHNLVVIQSLYNLNTIKMKKPRGRCTETIVLNPHCRYYFRHVFHLKQALPLQLYYNTLLVILLL